MSNKGGQPERSQSQRPGMGMGGGGRAPGMVQGIVEKPKNVRGALARLLGYLGFYRIYLSVTIVLTIVSTLLSLVGPYFIGVAIDQYVIPRDLEGLVRISLIISAIYLAGMVIDMGTGWVMATISQKSLKQMRKDLFEHVQTLSHPRFPYLLPHFRIFTDPLIKLRQPHPFERNGRAQRHAVRHPHTRSTSSGQNFSFGPRFFAAPSVFFFI